jgi:dTDP-4-dehydrorhamnose reductase
MREKVLITGGSGLLAVNWAKLIHSKYLVTSILHRRRVSIPEVGTRVESLSSLEKCYFVINKYKPSIVIHTAGLTSIEECESNFSFAKEVNTDLAKNIAIVCNELNIKLVHISTDHLFSGEGVMTSEEDSTNPINNYAKTKLEGELKVQENCNNALIVRTNFYGHGTHYRQSFSDLILNNLRHEHSIELFDDVFYTPILIDELCQKVHQLIDIDAIGIFNVVGNERLTKYEFGTRVADCFKLDSSFIKAISVASKLGLVRRPKDMSLSNTKLCKTLQCVVPSLDEQLQSLQDQEIERSSSWV